MAVVAATSTPASAEDRASRNRSSEGLWAIQGGPIDGDRVSLEGRYQSFLYATKDADGQVEIDCLDEHPDVSSDEEASE